MFKGSVCVCVCVCVCVNVFVVGKTWAGESWCVVGVLIEKKKYISA